MVVKKLKILSLFLSVFLFCNFNEVYAKELTCIYKGGLQSGATMLVQTGEGKLRVYINNKNNTPLIDDINWYSIDENAKEVNYEWDTGYYENGILSDCPSYTRNTSKTSNDGIKYTFYFYGQKTWHLDYERYKKYDEVPNNNNFKQKFTNDVDYSQEIKNTEWIGICEYENVTLYFNRNNLILDNKSSLTYSITTGFSLEELLEYYDRMGICPSLYRRVDQTIVNVGNTFNYVTYFLHNEKDSYEDTFIDSTINDTSDSEETSEKIDDCLDLFSQDFIDKINSILSTIRIFVPILLILLGTLDFSKAVFSSSEEEMKKASSKFMKRLMAAILVFLIPTLVNFLLDMANDIWNNIDPNSCNIG